MVMQKVSELTSAKIGNTLTNIRTWGSLIINPIEYGADPSGIKDSGPAIRLALADIKENGGGTVLFSDGTYLINSFVDATANPKVNFTLDMSNVTIQGTSSGSVTLYIGNGMIGEAVFGNFYDSSLTNVCFDNIIFNLNGQNNLQNSGSRASKAAILAYWCDGMTVRNCKIINAPGEHGVYVGAPNNQNNGKNIRIHDNEFYNVGDSITGNTNLADHSSIFATGYSIWIHHNKFENPNKSMRATAVEVEGINFFTHTNSIKKYNLAFITARLTGSWTGANGTFTRNIVVQNGQIYGNVVEDCLDGWWVENKELNGFKDVKFFSNTIMLLDEAGNGTRYMIRGESTITYPIINVEICNNTFKTNTNYASYSGTTLGIGIDFSENLFIHDNTFKNLAGFALRMRGTSTYPSKNFSIINNIMEDICSNSAESFVRAVTFQGYSNNGKIVNNKIKNIVYTGCTIGIQLYGGLSSTVIFNDVVFRDNEINVTTTDIESFLLNISSVSDNVFIFHKTNNASFDVRNQVQASAGSIVDNTKSLITYIKRNVWNLYDRGTTAPTSGQHYVNDYRTNSSPTETGTVGSKYVIKGWTCVVAGTPGTHAEDRALTGN